MNLEKLLDPQRKQKGVRGQSNFHRFIDFSTPHSAGARSAANTTFGTSAAIKATSAATTTIAMKVTCSKSSSAPRNAALPAAAPPSSRRRS